MKRQSVILAPDLPSERWWSMDYYWREFQKHIPNLAGQFNFKTALPDPGRSRLWDRHVLYPHRIETLFKSSGKNSILHILDHSYGHLCRSDVPTVVSCHDLAEWRNRSLSWGQYLWWKSRVRGILRAQHFFALSESTSNDLQEFFKIDPSQITVNPLGIDSRYEKIEVSDQEFERFPMLRVLQERKKQGDFLLLHVGSNISRKNIPTLLKAFKGLKEKGRKVSLVKAGEMIFPGELANWIISESLQDSVVEIKEPAFEELHRIYSLCDLLCFPSLYEGQGLPVLEAQVCGLPCVISSATSLKEVGGDSVLYHDPLNPEELATQIERVMDSPELRNNLIQKGFENVKRFTWGEHFNRLAGVYRKLTV